MVFPNIGLEMDWTIIIHAENQYAEIVTSGVADNRGSLEMAKAIPIALSNYRIKKVLIDHRNISTVAGNVADVHSRPKKFPQIGVILGIKVAEVVKPEHEMFFKFLEMVCVKRGFKFSVFNDKETALDWLLST